MSVLFYTVLSLCVLGVFLAVILYFVAQKFKVEEDPRIDEVEAMLPGANCGACGYPGCRGLADALIGTKISPGLFAFFRLAGHLPFRVQRAAEITTHDNAAETVTDEIDAANRRRQVVDDSFQHFGMIENGLHRRGIGHVENVVIDRLAIDFVLTESFGVISHGQGVGAETVQQNDGGTGHRQQALVDLDFVEFLLAFFKRADATQT